MGGAAFFGEEVDEFRDVGAVGAGGCGVGEGVGWGGFEEGEEEGAGVFGEEGEGEVGVGGEEGLAGEGEEVVLGGGFCWVGGGVGGGGGGGAGVAVPEGAEVEE